MAVNPVPDGYHTVTPYLVVRDASAALDFYAKAFGAKELMRMHGPGGSVAHAEMRIGDSNIMLADENPDWGLTSPQTLGGSGVSVFLYVPNVDALFAQAVSAGASVTMPLANQFWGDRYGKLRDPFGHVWNLATHVEDLSPEEIEKRAAAMAAS